MIFCQARLAEKIQHLNEQMAVKSTGSIPRHSRRSLVSASLYSSRYNTALEFPGLTESVEKRDW